MASLGSAGSSKAKPTTRTDSDSTLGDLVVKVKGLVESRAPTVKAGILRGILIRKRLMIENEKFGMNIKVGEIARKLAPLHLA